MDAADCALVVFAKAPVAGSVKTRLFRAEDAAAVLGRRLSAGDAALLHVAFLRDILEKGIKAGYQKRRLYVAGDASAAGLPALALRATYSLHAQSGADLGARMHHAISTELAAGAAGVVLIGTDSPTLPDAYLAQAATALTTADVVLGPAQDGGYYLIGAKTSVPEVFAEGIDWGTDTVLPMTMERLAALEKTGRSSSLLPSYYDVDTPTDLRWLITHLKMLGPESAPHTAAALRMLRLI